MTKRIDREIKAILFDKDGTLFDFAKTWEAWAAALLYELADDDDKRVKKLAKAIGFDLVKGSFHRDSLAIAGTNAQVAEVLAKALPGSDVAELEALLVNSARKAPLEPVTDLAALLTQLREADYALGVMTNDSEIVADVHLNKAGVRDHFDVVLGADSGHGAKPDPEPLIEFCRRVGVDPWHTAMIGDSTHDLIAADAAGMLRIAVLTGMAGQGELSPHADLVMEDISHIPDALGFTEG